MPVLKILVGPPGSGKSTLAEKLQGEGFTRISQDDMGKYDHFHLFIDGLDRGYDMSIDRMNFDKKQRERYIKPARERGYTVEIIVLHESYDKCLKRCIARIGHHPTIETEQDARNALATFFGKYERPTADEADKVEFVYPKINLELSATIYDLDGTLCNIDHRLHYVRSEGKKNWAAFNANVHLDGVNKWCKVLMNQMRDKHPIVVCSGRTSDIRSSTEKWLKDNNIRYDELFMRPSKDSRSDTIIKEVILDFELLTRYKEILFIVDDRPSVIRMWRSRGLTVLACNEKEF